MGQVVTLSPHKCLGRLLLLIQPVSPQPCHTVDWLSKAPAFLPIFKTPQYLVKMFIVLNPVISFGQLEMREVWDFTKIKWQKSFLLPSVVFSPPLGPRKRSEHHFQCAFESLQGKFTCRLCRTENICLK